MCAAELIVQGVMQWEKGDEGGPFIAAVLGLNPLTFFVPVTRVGYEVDLASLFGYRY